MLCDWLNDSIDEFGDAPFVEFQRGELWSRVDLRNRANQVSAQLGSLGVGRDSRVAVALPNGPAMLELMFATSRVGAAFCPINPQFKGELLHHALRTLQPDLLVTTDEFTNRIEPNAVSTTMLVESPERGIVGGGVRANRAEMGLPTTYDRRLEPTLGDVFAHISTSGTTGGTKSVPLSYHYFENLALTLSEPLGKDDCWYVMAPMFHTSAIAHILAMLLRGGRVFIAPSFSARTFWDDVESGKVTATALIGSMASYLDSISPAMAGSSLRYVMMSTGVNDPRAFAKKFEVLVYRNYGSTEMGISLRGNVESMPLGSCGTPVAGYEVRLVESGSTIEGAGTGELWVKHSSPTVTACEYFRDAAQSAENWEAGWFKTGDLFRRDDDGYYYFVDRLKDRIRRRGENVSSNEVERAIMSLGGIAEVAVIPTPAQFGEDDIAAFIVPDGEPGSPKELHARLGEILPRFMLPRFIEYVEALPTTPTGRVQKAKLREISISHRAWDSENDLSQLPPRRSTDGQ